MDVVKNIICIEFNYIICSGKYADPGRISTSPAVLNRLLRTSVLFTIHPKIYDCIKLEWSYL